MFYVDNNSGSPNMPALSPAQSNTPTWFTEGDKNKGISWIGQDWLNILQAELLNILAEAGITPDKGKLNQLTLSIKAIITANAYTQANNLKEILDAGIAAQAAARSHLGLGKLATKDGLGAGDVDAVSKANGGTFDNNIAVTGTVTSNQMVVSVKQYPGFTTSVSAQAGSQAPFYLGQVTLGAGDMFIPYIKESTVTTDGKKAVVSFGFNKNGIKPHASPAVHVATEDGKYQLWEFDTETGRLINNTTGGVALLSELAPVKKAIDDTQTGLAAQGVMWVTSADDLSNLPSGAHRFACNKAPATVLPAAGYFFIEVLAKRDVANGSCILATSDAGNVWIGLRYTAPTDTAFTWIQLNQNVENLGLTEAVKRANNAVQKTGDTMIGDLFLKSDDRRHFAIANEDGNARMWLYKDKGGDGVRLNNGIDGGGEFIFGKNSEFYSPGYVHAGAAKLANDGNVWGTRWNANGAWLWDVIAEQLAARDTNINTRATWDWVSQNFVNDIFLGVEQYYSPGSNTISWIFHAPNGHVLTGINVSDTGSNSADNINGVYYKAIQKRVNGVVMTIAG
ncbi:hypothetical protein IIG34_000770 [Salmonella enterica]|nr:hypothetical protein [Salmonella enterica]